MQASALQVTIEATHRSLEDRLRRATARTTGRGQPRDTYAYTDAFLAATSRHLAAVDDVVLRVARRRLTAGGARVHAYLHQARQLEMALGLVKARLYGEVHAVRLPWSQVWDDVQVQLSRHNEMERALVEDLLPHLQAHEHTELAERVYRSEVRAPTRPHPFTPHRGFAGGLARRLWAIADRFWDTAEGRIVPEPVRPHSKPHSHDSLIAQYLMAEPHFDQSAEVIAHHRRRRWPVRPPGQSPGSG